MLERAPRFGSRLQLLPQAAKDQVVRLWIVDLVARTLQNVSPFPIPRAVFGYTYLGSSVNTEEGNTRSQSGEHVMRVLSHIGLNLLVTSLGGERCQLSTYAGLLSNNVTGV